MNLENYTIKIWKVKKRSSSNGPEVEKRMEAFTPLEVVNKALQDYKIVSEYYAEVHLMKDGLDHCWVFTDNDKQGINSEE